MQESEQQLPADTLRARLKKLYPGVRESVLSRYLHVSRMVLAKLDQHSPGLDKLTPAVRIERLSLSWLVTGKGSPYLVHTEDSDPAARDYVQALLQDQPDLQIVVAHHNDSFVVVLHTMAESEDDDGAYAWRQVEVVAGPLGQCTGEVVLHRGDSLLLDPDEFRRLATGFMGNAELFGWEAAPEGLVARALPHQQNHSVRETSPTPYGVAQTARDRLVIQLLHSLDEEDQETMIRMLRGLQKDDRS